MSNILDRLKDALADRYAIEHEIGAGGMATVYLAEDLKHRRKVAVKVLRPELAATIGPERFLREIEVAARLTHPHILPLHDSGEADGFLYYVMPFVDGESLREKLNRDKQLSLAEATRFTESVASALDYAHRQGVVHRDIKPENIMLQDGVAMVADFGIALAVSTAGRQRLTETGLSLGTPAYMSPEQVSGEQNLDGRSDVYSLACVSFEMLAGRPPFIGPSSQKVMAQHVTDRPPAITSVRSDVALQVSRALAKAMAKTPADRFDTAAEFSRSLVMSETRSAGERMSVAVLPLANLSANPDNEYFSDGITEDIIAQLSKIGRLKVISRTSVMRFKERDHDIREVAGALGVKTVLEGSVRRVGNRVRIVVQLIDADSDDHLWTETYDRELTDIFEIQSDVALRVATALQDTFSDKVRARIEQKPTDDVDAHNSYLLGRFYLGKRTDEGLRRAVSHFEEALERDPKYAAPYAGLAEAYAVGAVGYRTMPLKESIPKAKEAIRTALKLDELSADAYACLGYISLLHDWDWNAAEEAFKRGIELNPNHVQAHQWYATYLIGARKCGDAHVMVERALELDPLSVVIVTESGWPYSYEGDHDRAIERYKQALEMDPNFALARYDLAWSYTRKGLLDSAITEYERAVESERLPFFLSGLGCAYAAANRRDQAVSILDELQERSKEAYGLSLWVACVHDALGDKEQALAWLDKAVEERDPFMIIVNSEWLPFESLQSDERFERIVKQVAFPG